MSEKFNNVAAWLVDEKVKSLKVGPAPYTPPADLEITIKTHAVAINPVGWAVQELALFSLNYSAVLGVDIAGEVVQVGTSVTRFKPGDRVLAQAVGQLASGPDSGGAFQLNTVVKATVASVISPNMSFEDTCVIPLDISTTASGLYEKTHLALPYPSVNLTPMNKVVLVWGASSSVECNGVQLANASGYEVFATASPKNFEYIKSLGATKIFDYRRANVVSEIVHALKGKEVAGVLDCITRYGAIEACADILRQSEGNKLIASAQQAKEDMEGGIKTKFMGGNLRDREVGPVIYEKFLEETLAKGKYIAAPRPHVFEKGLESIQGSFEAQKKVSAEKVVVTLVE